MADPPQTLDAGAQPPVGVANPSHIAFYIGNPPREMLIFSGVGLTDLYAEEEDPVIWREVVVKLGLSTTKNFTYTCVVGLASITCDDSDFNFFANTSSVGQDEQTGELELHTTLGASGDPGTLNRFTYHVQVLSDPIIGSIMGTIRWPDLYGQPSNDVQHPVDGVPPMFTVDAGVMVPDPDPRFNNPTFEARVTGFSTTVPQKYDGTWTVPYKIDNVPLGQVFTVQPRRPGASLVGTPYNYEAFAANFNPPTRDVELTLSAPSAIGVDFDMTLPAVPK